MRDFYNNVQLSGSAKFTVFLDNFLYFFFFSKKKKKRKKNWSKNGIYIYVLESMKEMVQRIRLSWRREICMYREQDRQTVSKNRWQSGSNRRNKSERHSVDEFTSKCVWCLHLPALTCHTENRQF